MNYLAEETHHRYKGILNVRIHVLFNSSIAAVQRDIDTVVETDHMAPTISIYPFGTELK